MPIIAVKESPFLIAMQGIVRAVQVQNDLLGRCVVRLDNELPNNRSVAALAPIPRYFASSACDFDGRLGSALPPVDFASKKA